MVLVSRSSHARVPSTLLAALLVAFASRAAETSATSVVHVIGVVRYDEPLTLSPTAVLQVTLDDVTLADAPAVTLTQQTIEHRRDTTLAFDLAVDPAKIDPKHDYAVSARITDPSGLLWTNGARYSVITHGRPTKVKVLVQAAHDFSFACDSMNFTARIGAGTVQLSLPDQSLALPHSTSKVPGANYASTAADFEWRNSSAARLKVGSKDYGLCKRVP
jgi:putative lipoprotein